MRSAARRSQAAIAWVVGEALDALDDSGLHVFGSASIALSALARKFTRYAIWSKPQPTSDGGEWDGRFALPALRFCDVALLLDRGASARLVLAKGAVFGFGKDHEPLAGELDRLGRQPVNYPKAAREERQEYDVTSWACSKAKTSGGSSGR